MTEIDDVLAAIAARHRLSVGVVQALAQALRSGRGGAQWSHPDLGGMGQWSGGTMLQIGDMFNDALKARVRAALEELATLQRQADPRPADDRDLAPAAGAWWPAEFGAPSAQGAQNLMRYACFPDRRRLVVERDGRTTVYDTGPHRLTGFAQAQGHGQTLAFESPEGQVTLNQLTML